MAISEDMSSSQLIEEQVQMADLVTAEFLTEVKKLELVIKSTMGRLSEETLAAPQGVFTYEILEAYTAGTLKTADSYRTVEMQLRHDRAMLQCVREMLEEEEGDVTTSRAYHFLKKIDAERQQIEGEEPGRIMNTPPLSRAAINSAEPAEEQLVMPDRWRPARNLSIQWNGADYKKLVLRGKMDSNDPDWED